MKVLILSDLHLGTRISRSTELLADIRRLAKKYDRVILNGDTLDRLETPECEPDSQRYIREAEDACQSRTGLPEILTGNHDPVISNTEYLYLPQSATLVFHGDCVADCTHPCKPSEQLLAAHLKTVWAKQGGRPTRFLDLIHLHRRAQGEHLRHNPIARDDAGLLNYLVNATIPPQKILHVLQYWYRTPNRIAALAATFDKPVKHVVIGHTHRPGHWNVGGIEVFNTGSYMPMSKPFAVSIDGHHISFSPVLRMLESHRTVVQALPKAAATEEA